MELLGTVNYHLIDVFIISFSQAWRVEMNLFTKNVRGFIDFGKQAEPKNPCMVLLQVSASKTSKWKLLIGC